MVLPKRSSRASGPKRYVLRLFVAGATPRSTNAVRILKAVCEERIHGLYDLKVIDIYQQPALAAMEQIVAVPTLVRKLPAPLRRFIGDMSDMGKIVAGLALPGGRAGGRQ